MSGQERKAKKGADTSLRVSLATQLEQARCACAKLRAQLNEARSELENAREQIEDLSKANQACEAGGARLSYITKRSLEGRQVMFLVLSELGVTLKQVEEVARRQHLDFDISFVKRVIPYAIDGASVGAPASSKKDCDCEPDRPNEPRPVCSHLYVKSEHRSEYCALPPAWVCSCYQCDKASHPNTRIHCCAEHITSVSELHLRVLGITARWVSAREDTP